MTTTEQPDTTRDAVITPRWRDRLTREAVQLVDAVHEHDRTEAGR